MDLAEVGFLNQFKPILGGFFCLISLLCSSCSTVSQLNKPILDIYTFADGFSPINSVIPRCETTKYKLKTHILPKTADEQRLQLARRLASGRANIDIMTLDVVWTAEFASADWIAPLPANWRKKLIEDTLSGPLKTVIWQNRIYAFPLWTNSLLLWYRKDLIDKYLAGKVPTTWDELLAASRIVGNLGGPTWIGVPGQQYEGLLVWFNSVLESAGGQILAPDGKTVTLADTPTHLAATIKALEILKAVATAKGADPAITSSYEDIIRFNMERGKSLFAMNWPYVFASMKKNAVNGAVPFLDLKKYAAWIEHPNSAQLKKLNSITLAKFAPALYPAVYPNTKAKVTIGGANLAVAATSKYRDYAFAAAACLRDYSAQKNYALLYGYTPALIKLYDDVDFKSLYPMGQLLKQQLQTETAAVRPISSNYQIISTLLVAKLSPVGKFDPVKLAPELAAAAQKAIDGKGIVP